MSIELDVEVGMDMVWVAVVIWDMSIMASSIVNWSLILEGMEGCR